MAINEAGNDLCDTKSGICATCPSTVGNVYKTNLNRLLKNINEKSECKIELLLHDKIVKQKIPHI